MLRRHIMSSAIISVIIPTCHRNDLLAKCLGCLAPGIQTLPAGQYEVIITDDGSKSTAEEMVREQYPWACWVAGPKKGPAANRNNGAKFAKGKWLAFTDDDCLPHPEWLKALSEAIQKDMFVYEGRTICSGGISSPLYHSPVNTSGGFLWSCNMMIYQSVFENLGGFDEDFPHPHLEDVDLRTRIQYNALSHIFVSHAVVDHPPRRLPGGNKMAGFSESDVFYWYKLKNKQPLKISTQLARTAMHRMRKIKHSPLGIDSLKAAYSMLIELSVIAARMPEWNRKYRDKFKIVDSNVQAS